MIFEKENDRFITAKCNMCKREYTFEKELCTKTDEGYSLEGSIKCKYCGQSSKSIDNYKKYIYYKPESRPLNQPKRVYKEIDLTEGNRSEEVIKCPKCGSTQFTPVTKGFGLGKAVLGGLLIGPVGLLGGVIGSKKIKLVCLRCKNSW